MISSRPNRTAELALRTDLTASRDQGPEQTRTPWSDMLAHSSTYLEMRIAVPLELTRIEIFHFKAPINEPIITSFGSIPARNALLVRIEDKGGAFGWGEVW